MCTLGSVDGSTRLWFLGTSHSGGRGWFFFFFPPLTHSMQENLHTQTHTPGAPSKTQPSCYISFLLKIRLAPNYNLNHLSAFRSVIVTTCHTVILQVAVVNFGIATTTTKKIPRSTDCWHKIFLCEKSKLSLCFKILQGFIFEKRSHTQKSLFLYEWHPELKSVGHWREKERKINTEMNPEARNQPIIFERTDSGLTI